ncbi:MAG TPA: hypothetical protein VMP11_14740 [Verrucomicrobiae bacterium]|nr:hypothetical protein [Verrucomicrobiae bacterium]
MKPPIASALILAAGLLSGCTSVRAVRQADPAPNAYSARVHLPSDLRRVVVLPVTCDNTPDAEVGRDALQPVLLAELTKVNAFEVVPISPDQLRAVTGKSRWEATELLPPDLFSRLHAATGCDAVLFCRLKQFRAYPPLSVGWDLRLVEVNQRSVLWAVDQVFDAGKTEVASAAQRYYARSEERSATIADPESVLMSPRLFGQYAAAASLAVLPAH